MEVCFRCLRKDAIDQPLGALNKVQMGILDLAQFNASMQCFSKPLKRKQAILFHIYAYAVAIIAARRDFHILYKHA